MIAATVSGAISDGVPPPKKIERTVAARRQRGALLEFGPNRGEKARLIDAAAPDMAVEVAIRAFRQAERPMDVNAKAGVGNHGSDAGHVVLCHFWNFPSRGA